MAINTEEHHKAFVQGLDLGMILSALERAKSLADMNKEYRISEQLDDMILDIRDRRRALRQIIVG